MNRHERRAAAAARRNLPYKKLLAGVEKTLDINRKHRAASTRARARAAHQRAVARRQAADGTAPVLTRAKLAFIKLIAKRHEQKKRRNEAYQRKHALV